jgi:HSP20 family protein
MTQNVLDRMLTLARAVDDSFAAGDRYDNRGVWFPALDVYETEQAYVVELDLPGVHPENVDLSFEQGTLTIRGTRGPTVKTPEKGELRVFSAERVSGSFVRSVRLPEYVDSEKIEATYDNGVLMVTIPKAAAARARRITIRGAAQGENGKQLNG